MSPGLSDEEHRSGRGGTASAARNELWPFDDRKQATVCATLRKVERVSHGFRLPGSDYALGVLMRMDLPSEVAWLW